MRKYEERVAQMRQWLDQAALSPAEMSMAEEAAD